MIMQIKLGFIGCGNMATAIINGAVSSDFIAGENIFVYDIDSEKTRFLTVIDTHGPERDDFQLLLDEKTVIISNWIIECNFTNNGESLISVVNNKTGVSLKYCESENEGSTQIVDIVNSEKKELSLCDEFPNLEI